MTAGRRRLKLGRIVLVAILVIAGVAVVSACVPRARPPGPPATSSFAHKLAVPPLATAHRHGSDVTFYLRLRPGMSDFGRGVMTRTWGINGDYLGPTLRARRGDRVTIHVTNGLTESTTMHWHGMHLPARMDGGPHQPIAPGSTWSPNWTIRQPAATLWYHPHPDGRTADQVYRGLAGMFIIDDDQAARLALPHRYGVDDIPVIIQDKLFQSDGQLQLSPRGISNVGLLGDTILVNGTPSPYRTVTTRRIRLRLLNASNARVYNLGFSDNRDFALIGTDGGLLRAPVPLTRVQLAPGERAEIVVTMRPGEHVALHGYRPALGAGFLASRLAGGGDSFDVLQLRAADRLARSPALPHRLVVVPALRAASATRTRTFELGEDEINGHHMDMSHIDQTVTLGATEIWDVTNHDGSPHTFHVHGVQFQVLDQNGAPPPPALRGWKDTVYVAPETDIRLIMHFTDYADPAWPYMFHCHILRHEDAGMMGQFLVLAPGQQPAPVKPAMPAAPTGHDPGMTGMSSSGVPGGQPAADHHAGGGS
jgi:FtsP/CotA-like multicopper oxidase with cupredoxin domain